jgi:hypothetical protein
VWHKAPCFYVLYLHCVQLCTNYVLGCTIGHIYIYMSYYNLGLTDEVKSVKNGSRDGEMMANVEQSHDVGWMNK